MRRDLRINFSVRFFYHGTEIVAMWHSSSIVFILLFAVLINRMYQLIDSFLNIFTVALLTLKLE